MEQNTFITFQKFNSLAEAEDLILLLKASDLPIQIEDDSPNVDITFSGNTLQDLIRIKVKQSDFESANQLLEKHAAQLVEQISEDYYLFTFADNELIEVIEKEDEWSKEDFLLALKILKSRGLEITKDKIEEIRENRFNDLIKPETGENRWIVFGYVSAALGGLLGLFLGWFYMTFKKTAPNGQRFFAFDGATRKTGKRIFLIGLISILFWLVYWVLYWN